MNSDSEPMGYTTSTPAPLAATVDDIQRAYRDLCVRLGPAPPEMVVATPSIEALGVPTAATCPREGTFCGHPIVVTDLVDRPRLLPAEMFRPWPRAGLSFDEPPLPGAAGEAGR